MIARQPMAHMPSLSPFESSDGVVHVATTHVRGSSCSPNSVLNESPSVTGPMDLDDAVKFLGAQRVMSGALVSVWVG